jgi:hypothetical protein
MDTLRAPERWLASSDEVAVQLRPALRMARGTGPSPAVHAEMWSGLAAKIAVMPAVGAGAGEAAPAQVSPMAAANDASGSGTALGAASGVSVMRPATTPASAASGASAVANAWWLALTAVVAATVGYGAARLTAAPRAGSAASASASTEGAIAPASVATTARADGALPYVSDAGAIAAASAATTARANEALSYVSDAGAIAAASAATTARANEALPAARDARALELTASASKAGKNAPTPPTAVRARKPRVRAVPAASGLESEPRRTSATAAPPGDWAAELDLLARARRVVATAPQRALELAAEHARRFETGVLVQEREVLAIEALSRLGRRDLAAMRARRFSERYPGSPHRVRLAALLEQ